MADNEQVRDDQPDAAVDQRGGARPGERVAYIIPQEPIALDTATAKCGEHVETKDILKVIKQSLKLLGSAVGFTDESMTDQQVIINPDNATDDIPGIDASLFSFWKCITVSISEHMQYRPKSGNHFLLPGRNLPGPMSLSRKLASAGQQKKQCYPKVLRFLVHVAAVVNGMGDKGAKLRYYLGDIATIADEEDDCQYLDASAVSSRRSILTTDASDAQTSPLVSRSRAETRTPVVPE